MFLNRTVYFILSRALTILVCDCEAHEENHPHQHRPNGQPQFSHTDHGQGSSHSHGPPGSSGHTHSHGPGQDHHTHQQVNLQRSRFVISNLWNGSLDTVSQALDKGGNQVVVTLEDNPKLNSVVLYIDAPFYDDPAPPNGSPGQAYFKLWEYEVVEAFFLAGQSEKYIELEFGPHGQHLVLLLDGERKAIKHSLPLNYRSQINRQTNRWYGKAIIPLDYFPPQVDRFNAYAIHDQDVKPIYKSLYPSNGAQPDFHDLPSFAAFNALSSLKNINQLSSTWEEAIKNPIKED
jgi:hypothetical protein